MGLIWALVYLVCMIAIAMHLWHGFQSAFQSLGARTGKYKKLIVGVGRAFAILIPLGFAIIPLYIHFGLDISAEKLELINDYLASDDKKEQMKMLGQILMKK